MGSQLKELNDVGQSIWLDNIRRSMFASGELHRLIDSGLRGMTSNPTIFEKAIGSGNDYDAQLASLIGAEHDPNHLFEALAIDDIRHACDEFRALFDATKGGDGFVSLEVSPLLANDTKATADAARRLWKMVDRPNVMIKIPATPEGIPAITATIAAGINVNVTLIFSLETYEDVANAYIAGLEQRVAGGGAIDRIGSVASVFVSRIDTAVDKLLEEKAKADPRLKELAGKTGVANLKLIYAKYKKLFESERFEKLKAAGGRVQRPLWASTGVKNPAYPDLLYVENLIGKNTVNTLPPATLDALVDHGRVIADSVESGLDEAHAAIEALAGAQISLFDVTQKLQLEGVRSFADSYNAMLGAIASKQKQLGGSAERVAISLDAAASASADAAVAALANDDFLQKLWKHDPEPWSSEPQHAEIVKHALGWLDFPKTVLAHAAELTAFANDVKKIYSHVVVLGMGGSSLAPDVLRATFGHVAGYPLLHVLDSSDPAQVATLEASLDLAATLFIVSSKSGTTTEPEAFFRYFYERVQKIVGADRAGKQFVAITDPGTQLGAEAKEHGFVRIFENDPDIGGRYSALSYFGMVPAALAGYDVASILDRGLGAFGANGRTEDVAASPAVRFGATLGTLAKAGRDKLTIVTHPEVAAFGTWAEQLVAESTGKSGTGIVPVEGETLGMPHEYGSDRVFVFVGAGLPPDEHLEGALDGGAIETRLHLLEEAGHPVVRLTLSDRLDIGEQFALWEIAVATAGAVLGIDAFDQPNVQESKDNTKRLLAEYKRTGTFPEPDPKQTNAIARVVPVAGSAEVDLGHDFGSALAAILAQVRAGDYVAFTAYIERSPEHESALHDVRLKIRSALKVATTVGFGPRFLHSTGQLHKGGPNTGVFLQLTADTPKDRDLEIPGMVTFGTLLRAQALGDFESLDKRDRRGARLHFTVPLAAALEALSTAVDDAVSAKA